MRKGIIVLALVFGFGLVQVNAQGLISAIKERVTIGVKGEANYSNFIVSDMPGYKSEMGVGANIGPTIRFDISKHFAIQEDILFTYSSSEFTKDGIKDTYQYFGTEVPIYLTGQWGTLPGGRIYGGIGPYFGMGFSAKLKDSDINLYKKVDGKTFMKRVSYGAAAYIGYEFRFGLQVNASYKIGANTLDAKKDDSKMCPQSISLGIGYRF